MLAVNHKEETALRSLRDKAHNLEHLQKFEAAMAPDPKEWVYLGEVVDAGPGKGLNQPKCLCGHPIRYIFIIRRLRDGAVIEVGSTCIDSSAGYLMQAGNIECAEQLQKALAEHKKRLAEAQKAAREQEDNAKVSALLTEVTAWQAWLKESLPLARQHYVTLPWFLYAGKYRWIWNPPSMATPKNTAKKLAKLLAELRPHCEELAKETKGYLENPRFHSYPATTWLKYPPLPKKVAVEL